VFFFFLFAISNQQSAISNYLFAADKIIAIVNNDIITQKDLNDFLNFMRLQLADEYKAEELEKKLGQIKVDILERIIEDRLILQEAKKSKLKINEESVQARIKEIKKQYSSDNGFQHDLSSQGLTQSDLEEKFRDQILMYNVINEKIKDKIIINPGEITAFYEENKEKFLMPQQREVESISFNDENLAKEVSGILMAGGDFQETVKKYSLSVNKLGLVQAGQLKNEIEKIIFNLKAGAFSQPQKFEGSFYIFRVINIIEPKQQKLADAQDAIREFLFEKKMQEKLVQWLDDLKKQSYIKIFQN